MNFLKVGCHRMACVLNGYTTILKEIVGNKIDNDTIDFMGGLLEDEKSELICRETIQSLLGPFLLDGRVCSTDEELHHICERMAEAFREKILRITIPENTKKPSRACDFPFNSSNGFSVKSFIFDSGSGFIDPFLGIRIEAQAKSRKEKQLKLMREWERSRAPLPSPIRRSGDKQLEKVSDVVIDCFSVAIGGRELLKDAALKVVIGHRYGLIGRNGIGKSTLLSSLVRHEVPGLPKDLNISCVEQELNSDVLDMTALDAVLATHVERDELLKRERILLQTVPQTDDAGKELGDVYRRLEEIDAEGAEAEAASMLSGLGFSVKMQGAVVRELSGGWRVRVALARGLFATPDILCLDEPTNHLDLHAVNWLTIFLQSSSMTSVIVSHARTFLNDVCTDIIELSDKKLKYFKGDYDTYERVKSEANRLQQRQFEAQQLKREHTQKFIDRFRYKASNAASVQSRIKALSKLPHLEAVANDPSLFFKFSEPEELPTPVLQLDGAWFSYTESVDDDRWILKDVDFSVDLKSRIAVCGVNGCGKSTLLKLLTGTCEPQKGFCKRANKLRIGYFSQHHVEQLDLTLNSVQQFQTSFPKANLKEEDARKYLGQFGISGFMALEPLYVLSGGQKSRVAIALMAFTNPHIMILDEPTNHLDLNAVEALIVGLNEYKGGIVVVSHDMHLLSCVVDDIFHVSPEYRKVVHYKGSIESYRRDLLQKNLDVKKHT